MSTRPNTLHLSSPSTNHLSIPIFRTFLSHPGTFLTPLIPLDDNSISTPLEFSSVPEVPFPPVKRHRSQTSATASIVPLIIEPVLPSSSTIELIKPSELADKLQVNLPIAIFDCGSPFRHSESRIENSILLPVADKISRRRFKINAKKDGLFNIKQLHQSHAIILYDDSNNQRRSSSKSTDSADNDLQLPIGIKFACDEIQTTLTDRYPPIFILNCAFNQFFDLYPNLCESLQSHSSPSSPTHQLHDNSSTPRLAPFTAPILPSIMNDHDLLTHPMTYISHGIYIGSEFDAKNLDGLKSERIEYIVNVTSHVPLYHSEQMHYCHLPADDTQKQNLLVYFDQAHGFIQQAIENNNRVLVHCVAGISRSPVIVISFLMRYAQMSMNDAYELVKRKRSIIAPNLNFMGQLLQYEKKLREEK